MDKQAKNTNTELYGVENIKAGYSLIAHIGEGAHEIITTKEGKRAKAVSVVGGIVLKTMGNFPKLREIPKEYKDMSDAEREEVNQAFAKELDLPNSPEVEALAEKTQKALSLLIEIGFDISELRKAA